MYYDHDRKKWVDKFRNLSRLSYKPKESFPFDSYSSKPSEEPRLWNDSEKLHYEPGNDYEHVSSMLVDTVPALMPKDPQ